MPSKSHPLHTAVLLSLLLLCPMPLPEPAVRASLRLLKLRPHTRGCKYPAAAATGGILPTDHSPQHMPPTWPLALLPPLPLESLHPAPHTIFPLLSSRGWPSIPLRRWGHTRWQLHTWWQLHPRWQLPRGWVHTMGWPGHASWGTTIPWWGWHPWLVVEALGRRGHACAQQVEPQQRSVEGPRQLEAVRLS